MFDQWLTRLLDPGIIGLEVSGIQMQGDDVLLMCATNSYGALCPACQQLSRRIHSGYNRNLIDVPLRQGQVRVQLRVRRFFCDVLHCPQRIFGERITRFAKAYARRTEALNEWLRPLVYASSANCGSRLAQRHGVSISPNTLLRLVRQSGAAMRSAAEVIGIDDWAFRKGRCYGAIVVDLESHTVMDVLSERTASTIGDWLKDRPEVKIVSRDRGDSMIAGIREGAPQAQPVADRWHLHHNLGEMLQGIVESHHADLRRLIRFEMPPTVTPAPTMSRQYVAQPKFMRERQAREQRYRERYDQAHQLHATGASTRAIAHQLHLSRVTVGKLLDAKEFPGIPYRGAEARSPLNPYKDYLCKRWHEGQHNIKALQQEIHAQGYSGQYASVWTFMRQMITPSSVPVESTSNPTAKTPTIVIPSVRQAAKWLSGRNDDLSQAQQHLLQQWLQSQPLLQTAKTFADQFSALLRERGTAQPQKLSTWLAAAQASGISKLQSFAKGISQDLSAVENAMTLPWSNGQVEGQVNRLKLIKRQMYGRAKLDLLRLRVMNKV